jgi:hypothetical protein
MHPRAYGSEQGSAFAPFELAPLPGQLKQHFMRLCPIGDVIIGTFSLGHRSPLSCGDLRKTAARLPRSHTDVITEIFEPLAAL